MIFLNRFLKLYVCGLVFALTAAAQQGAQPSPQVPQSRSETAPELGQNRIDATATLSTMIRADVPPYQRLNGLPDRELCLWSEY